MLLSLATVIKADNTESDVPRELKLNYTTQTSLYLDQFKLVLVTGQPLTVRIVDSAELCEQCLVNNQDSHLTICSWCRLILIWLANICMKLIIIEAFVRSHFEVYSLLYDFTKNWGKLFIVGASEDESVSLSRNILYFVLLFPSTQQSISFLY